MDFLKFFKNKHFAQDMPLGRINRDKIPQHVAIIMDGNGRWAQKRGLPRYAGHKAGVEALKDIVKACIELNIKILSVFAFSTENWKRPKEEVSILMELLTKHLATEKDDLHKNGVKINCIGSLDKLPPSAQTEIAKAHALTKKNHKLILNIALNYGGRLEIVEAAKKLAAKICEGNLKNDEVTEEIFASLLFTGGQADPDLLIRPSGEMRLSNFYLWQTAYTEIYVSSVLWPDFRKDNLIEAIIDYQNRDRRFGGIKK
ncbi:isoprenyl transferase [Desulfitibacter alkalitolerans]|uniref:isoprenyl transferase n=1 Tax=Desulfitibacter alkalitolerans TaxID=264641 RepID=UPI00047F0B36|nr:isoprenyl transferase [Desulfitibacter alkalitolerans]